MNFKDFYQPGKLTISFEIFPPKTEKGVVHLFEALKDLSSFNPAFISVTYGSGGSTRDLTRDLAIQIRKELNLTTAFHFTCVGSGREAIRDYVEYLKKEGLNLVVALRGDPPKGEDKFTKPTDGFSYASELVRYLKEIDGFSIAVAGYPEGHIECPSKEEDLYHLKEKVDGGADIVITQLYFDNRDFFDFVDRARGIGLSVPIIPGVMPILNIKQIKRITDLCGARIPDELIAELEKNRDDDNAMREIGISYAKKQCRELIEKGVPGIHFYILNKAYSTRKVLELISTDQSPEVGIQARRTLWKLGDRTDPDETLDYYVRHLTRIPIGEIKVSALSGIQEMGEEAKQAFPQVRAAVLEVRERIIQLKESVRTRDSQHAIHEGDEASSYYNRRAYYDQLVLLHNELFPTNPIDLIDAAIIENPEAGKLFADIEFYDEETIRRGLQSFWRFTRWNNLVALWGQPGRQETGLEDQWVPQLIDSVIKPGSWFHLFNRPIRYEAILLLGETRGHGQEVIPVIAPYILSEDQKLSDAAIKAMENLAINADESAVMTVLKMAQEHPDDLMGKTALEFLGSAGEAAKPAIPGLVEIATDTSSPLRNDALTALKSLSVSLVFDEESYRSLETLLAYPDLRIIAKAFAVFAGQFVHFHFGRKVNSPSDALITTALELLPLLNVLTDTDINWDSISFVLRFLSKVDPERLARAEPHKLESVLEWCEKLLESEDEEAQKAKRGALKILAEQGREKLVLSRAQALIDEDLFEDIYYRMPQLTALLPLVEVLGRHAVSLIPRLQEIRESPLINEHPAGRIAVAAAILLITEAAQTEVSTSTGTTSQPGNHALPEENVEPLEEETASEDGGDFPSGGGNKLQAVVGPFLTSWALEEMIGAADPETAGMMLLVGLLGFVGQGIVDTFDDLWSGENLVDQENGLDDVTSQDDGETTLRFVAAAEGPFLTRRPPLVTERRLRAHPESSLTLRFGVPVPDEEESPAITVPERDEVDSSSRGDTIVRSRMIERGEKVQRMDELSAQLGIQARYHAYHSKGVTIEDIVEGRTIHSHPFVGREKVRSYLEVGLDPALVAQLDQLDSVYFALGALAMETGITKLNDFKVMIRDELERIQTVGTPINPNLPGLPAPANTGIPSVTNIPRPIIIR